MVPTKFLAELDRLVPTFLESVMMDESFAEMRNPTERLIYILARLHIESFCGYESIEIYTDKGELCIDDDYMEALVSSIRLYKNRINLLYSEWS